MLKETGQGSSLGLTPIGIVKDAVSIEAYASSLTELKNNRGRCPLHGGESDNAFSVRPDKGKWKCFRCDDGGDLIDLAVRVEGCSKWDATLLLAERFGVELPKPKPDSWIDWQ